MNKTTTQKPPKKTIHKHKQPPLTSPLRPTPRRGPFEPPACASFFPRLALDPRMKRGANHEAPKKHGTSFPLAIFFHFSFLHSISSVFGLSCSTPNPPAQPFSPSPSWASAERWPALRRCPQPPRWPPGSLCRSPPRCRRW